MVFRFVVCLMVSALASACAANPANTPTRVSLAALVRGPEQWKGKVVAVQGTLLQVTDPDGTSYGIVEDAKQNRIGLKRGQDWASFEGRVVRASGTVEFDPSFGWFLANPTVIPTTSGRKKSKGWLKSSRDLWARHMT